jgi:hypothetical protein
MGLLARMLPEKDEGDAGLGSGAALWPREEGISRTKSDASRTKSFANVFLPSPALE